MPIDAEFVNAIAKLKEEGLDVTITDVRLPGVAESEVAAGTRTYALIPAGHEFKDLTSSLLDTLPNPQHRNGTVELASLDSYGLFLLRMKEDSSCIFADKPARLMQCVLDYHEAVNPTAPLMDLRQAGVVADDPPRAKADLDFVIHGALPRWGRFRANYRFPISEPWKRWSGKNKKAMSQGELAEWIEENITDVLDPAELQSDSTKKLIGELGLKLAGRSGLLGAARGLEITATETVAQAVNTSTGETQISYQESHTPSGANAGTAPISVPSAFIIGVPVFEGGAWYQLLVRLRYRKSGGSLVWSYDVYQLDKAMEDAFTSSCEAVRDRTGLPLFYATFNPN